jgi:peptidoglycan/xylan/chitin deacetylase (PgdA/CDA1 family)
MTFDAHDDNSQVDYILSVLRKYEIRAVFFLTGHFIKKYPGDTRKIMREGHLVGNHALTHTYFRNEDQLRYELQETERVFLRTTGYAMERVWHSPFLQHLDPKWEWIIRAAERQGYRHIDVSFDTIDWAREGSAGYRSSEDFMRAFRGMIEKDRRSFRAGGERKGERPGGIVMLMHPGKYRREPLVRALPRIIEHLRASGYRVEDGARLTGIR